MYNRCFQWKCVLVAFHSLNLLKFEACIQSTYSSSFLFTSAELTRIDIMKRTAVFYFFYFKGKPCSRRKLPSSTHLWTGAALHEYITQIRKGVLDGYVNGSGPAPPTAHRHTHTLSLRRTCNEHKHPQFRGQRHEG